MSFLADPPLLVAAGAAVERLVDDRERAARIERGVAVLFVTGSAALYLNLPVFRWMYRPFGSESGRDFMLNHGLLRIPHRRPPWWVHAGAAAALATYPLWLRAGRRLGGGRA
jgi:hypothetical protein